MGVGLGGGNFISGAELVADEGSAFSTLGCCSLCLVVVVVVVVFVVVVFFPVTE